MFPKHTPIFFFKSIISFLTCFWKYSTIAVDDAIPLHFSIITSITKSLGVGKNIAALHDMISN